jgi:DNA ligase (NAD+)
MTKEEAKKEINRLSGLVAYHNKLYYQEGQPTIADYEYDQLLAKLIQLEDKYPDLRRRDSPTQVLGELPNKNFVTVYHQYPMLSLSNSYSPENIENFMQRIQKQLLHEPIEFFCELKFDGIAASLLYKQGKLDRVVTRGDGMKGDDITKNAQYMLNLPQLIQFSGLPIEFEVRGEILMPLAKFEALNQLRLADGEEPLANPRNATAGVLKTLKSHANFKNLLECHVYSLRSPHLALETQEAGIQLLAQWGFLVSETYKKCKNLAEVLAYINYWEHARKELLVGIDGVVIKVNSIGQQQKLGLTAKSPRWAIAHKYKPENLSTILEQVDFQVGRTGVITPVAHLKPILLAGTTVRKASLHNAKEIERLDLHLGDTVFVEKRGDIIPKVTGVDLTKRKSTHQPVKFIRACPACGTALVSRHTKEIYYCPNHKNCLPQIQGLLAHFVQRKAMNIQAIGKKTIELFTRQGLVRTAADLYQLRYPDICSLAGFQDLSTNNILRGIQQSKQRPFESVLFGLGIPYVGEVVATKLAKHFPDIVTLAQAHWADLVKIPDIGDEIASSLISYFQDPDNLQLIRRLQEAGLQLIRTMPSLGDTTPTLLGKNFVLSGTFDNFDREQLKELIKSKGGRILASISKKLHYLVIGHNPGPLKLHQAQALDIPTINEQAIMKMLEA